MNFIRHYLLAVQFFTRIPVTGRLADWVGFSPALLRASARHFPGVGLLVGVVAAGVYGVLAVLLPETTFTPLVAAVMATLASVLLTGAFHEDGLADVADGLGGSYDKARALEIMKDSRVGAFGALALVLALLAKVALLALLGSVDGAFGGWGNFEDDAPLQPWANVCSALIAGHVVSRTLPLLLIYWLPHVGNVAASKSKPLADQISIGSVAVAFLWCFIALALVSYAQEAMHLGAACGMATIALLYMYRLFKRRLQGFTGDCLGATQQLCEIAFYLGLAIAL